MWEKLFPRKASPPSDPLTQAILDQNRILLALLHQSGVALPPRFGQPSAPTPSTRTEADVTVISRGRRVEIQTQEQISKLPEHILHPAPIDPAHSSLAGTQVVGGFSAMTGTSPATGTSPTSTPSPIPGPSTEPK